LLPETDRERRRKEAHLPTNSLFPAVAPASIEISGRAPGQQVDVNENEQLELECVVKDAKPAAGVRWYRHDVEITEGGTIGIHLSDTLNRSFFLSSVTTSSADGTLPGRFTTKSKLTLRPTSRDDATSVKCEADNHALRDQNRHMGVTVVLSVLCEFLL